MLPLISFLIFLFILLYPLTGLELLSTSYLTGDINIMKIIFIFLITTLFSFAKKVNTGVLPHWNDLGMTENDYYGLSSFRGLLCGSLFAFLITR